MGNEFVQIFRDEAEELLRELESSLLELEKNTGDEELIRRIFRALHTLKGSGTMFGFDDISKFSHEIENVFDLVRKGSIVVNKQIIDLSLAALDVIKKLLNRKQNSQLKSYSNEILQQIKQCIGPEVFGQDIGEEINSTETLPAVIPSEEPGEEITFRIRFIPNLELLRLGTDIISLLKEICVMGYCEIVPHIKDVPVLEEIVPDYSYIYWDILLTTTAGINAIKDVFILIEDNAEINIDIIDEGKKFDGEEEYKKLGYILVERGDLTEEEMEHVLIEKKRFGELLVEKGLVEGEKIESALMEQKHIRELRNRRRDGDGSSTLRVSSEKADKLVDLVGELVTLQAHLEQVATKVDNPALIAISEEAQRLIGDLREVTMNIRMIPIGTYFARFTRLVRDLSGELKKKVELNAAGGETELDKTIIEKLNDPLAHLIRNCIDHGIEAPEIREKLGKGKVGNISLSVSYSGPHVRIIIKDDGRGIEPETIKNRALSLGLLNTPELTSEKELFQLLFEPGFSTAQTVTNISGRGVGLDVVKKNIDALRGTIQIESSKGEGTTVTLKIPLTLAIIDGLLVRIAREFFIIPLTIVEEIMEFSKEELENSKGRNIKNIRGRVVPFIVLREQFDIFGQPPDIQTMVLVEAEQKDKDFIGFVVDEVIGKHQTVIKSLGKVYQNVEGLSGATILGDGTVALILDISSLIMAVEIDEQYALE